MALNSSTASDYNNWREVYGEIAAEDDKNSEEMNMHLALKYYASLEEKCDALIQEQDSIIRSVMRHVPPADTSDDADMLYGFHPETTEPPSLVSTPVMPYKEFRQVANLANKVVPKHMPMATNRFMRQAGSAQIDVIENLEIDIGIIRQHMSNVEVQILDTLPKTMGDIAAKLKFMSMLMLDGNDMEVDYFAYLVEECAEILLGSRATV